MDAPLCHCGKNVLALNKYGHYYRQCHTCQAAGAIPAGYKRCPVGDCKEITKETYSSCWNCRNVDVMLKCAICNIVSVAKPYQKTCRNCYKKHLEGGTDQAEAMMAELLKYM